MIDRGPATDSSEKPADGVHPDTAEVSGESVADEPHRAPVFVEPEPSLSDSLAALEARVGRLEEGLARVRDTQELETRIAGRVLEQVRNDRPSAAHDSAAVMVQAGRHLLPAAVGALHAHAAVEARAEAAASVKQPWLIVELYADLRTLLRMARDPLYRTVWLGRALLPLALVAAIFTSELWMNLVPGYVFLPAFLAGLLTKAVDLFLAFVLCKALQREIRRYRETVADPAPARRP